MIKYKLAVTDLDGTLLNNKKEVSDLSVSKIKNYISKTNTDFVIASGRPEHFIRKIAKRFNLGESLRYGICYNGGMVFDFDQNKAVYEQLFDKNHAAQVVNYLLSIGAQPVIFCDKFIYSGELIERFDRAYGDIYKVIDLKNFDYELNKIYKISAFGIPSNEIIPNNIHDIAEFAIYGEVNGYANSEVSPKNISKAVGLMKVCEILGVDKEDVIAFGDASNDKEMLSLAGRGVAMANSESLAIGAADEHIDISNDEDGVARYLDSLLN